MFPDVLRVWNFAAIRLIVLSLILVLGFASPCIAQKTHVQGYYRKDGTYVHGYDRGTSSTHYKSSHTANGYSADPSVQRDSHGRIKRSAAAKDAFKRQQPCPSTGRRSGACPGYVIDHVKPLECGGADAPSNMQSQTTAAGKAKDKTERYCR